jgi:hypothetical protein
MFDLVEPRLRRGRDEVVVHESSAWLSKNLDASHLDSSRRSSEIGFMMQLVAVR